MPARQIPLERQRGRRQGQLLTAQALDWQQQGPRSSSSSRQQRLGRRKQPGRQARPAASCSGSRRLLGQESPAPPPRSPRKPPAPRRGRKDPPSGSWSLR
jgi:hypothetical protein